MYAKQAVINQGRRAKIDVVSGYWDTLEQYRVQFLEVCVYLQKKIYIFSCPEQLSKCKWDI